MKLAGSDVEGLAATAVVYGLPRPIAEYRFAPPRLWRFDLAWTGYRVAVEIEGGMYGRGRKCPMCGRRSVAGHTSIERIKTDIEKYNAAALESWAVLRFTPDQVATGGPWETIRKALEYRGWRS